MGHSSIVEKDWFNQPIEPVDLNNLEYISEPEPINTELRITSIDKHVGDDDYIAPLKKPEEEDPIAKLDLVDTHSDRFEAVDYETTYKTMDPPV